MTLKTGSIENSGGAGAMTVGTGSTLNLYTNSIANLSGTHTVNGSGTLGIATYDGTKTIGLGDTATGDLLLPDTKFSTVFGPGFTHYAIGNSTQGTINVANSSLGKDVTLQADNINFAGDMTLTGKTLVVNAKTAANQTAGKIKAAKLATVGGNIALEKDNAIGTLAADALSVKVKSNALTIGAITTPAGAPVASRTIKGVKAGEVGGTAGDIELSADAMTFTEGVEGKGNLTLQQANAATNLNVGTAGTGLNLPENLFDGAKIKDGFKHVYLGREDATGATSVGGTLNFVDPTTIRSGKTAGSMTVDGSANIRTNGNDFALESKDLTTAAGSKVNTGAGDLTLKTDKIDLNGKMEGTKALNILPMSHTQDINLGANDPARLSLLNRYFSGNDRTFWEYEIVNIGDRGGGGRLYQSGVIDTPFTVNIQQAITSGSGGVNISGQINTNGRDYTVGSREVNLNNAQINADSTNGGTHGNVAIQADTLTHTGSKITGHGDVSFDTYTPGKTISFGTPGSGGAPTGLVLPTDVFSGTGLLQKNPDGTGFKKIRIGGQNAGDISVGNVTVPNGLADAVAIKTGGNVTSTGVLQAVPTLEVEANSVNLTGPNEIKNLGNITSATGVTVETKGGTNVTGVIKGNNAAINIKNQDGGNVTIAPGGKIIGTGTSDVLIEAKGGAFKNKGGANAIQTAPGQRYIVHTKDSVENEIDGLVFQFRRYGTDYTQRNSITIPAGQNAMFYKYQPELKLYSTRAYGDANGAFYNDSSGFHIVDDGNVKRRTLDAAEIQKIYDTRASSGNYAFGAGVNPNTDVNADVTTATGTITHADADTRMRAGARTYGTNFTNATEEIGFTGPNALNYKVTVDFRIVPRKVTVTGKTETVDYSGNPHNYTGLNGVTFTNFANGQTAATAGLTGSVSYTPIADATKTTGFAQGALHAGQYDVGIVGSNLSANNYVFDYKPGKLTIKPRDIHFTAPNGTRIYGTANNTVAIPSPTYTGTLAAGDSFANYTVRAVDGGGNAVTERTGVGSYTMQVENATLASGSRGYASDYNITSASGTLTITPRALTITAGNKSRAYGTDNSTAGYVDGTAKVNVGATTATSGLVNGDAIYDVTEAIDPTATATTNAGAAGLWTKASTAHFSSGTANNYNITYVDGHFNITKRALTLAAGDKSRIYGTANSTANYVNGTNLFRVKAGTNLVNGDTISTVTETIDSRATVTTDAGTPGLKTQIANAVFGTGNASNYDISYEDGSFAITPRDLTLRAGDKTRIYGTENSTAVYTGGTTKFRADAATATTGLVNGDTVTDVTETTNAVRTTNAGTTGLKTSITNAAFGTGKASNYNIHYVDGGFDITKRDLYITAGDKSRAYGADNATAQYVNGTSRLNVRPADAATGLANGDRISSVTETIDPTAAVTTNAGTPHLWTRASAAQFSHGTDANYNIHYADGRFTITPREVLITAGSASRDYGAPNPVITAYMIERGDHTSQRGLLAGDDISGITSHYAPSITSTTRGGRYAGVIHVDPASVESGYAGASARSNYRFNYAPGDLTIAMRGFDMSTPEGAAVTTSSAAAAQATTGTTNGGSGVTAAAVPTENRTGSNPSAEGVTVQMPQDAAPTNWANRVVMTNDSTSEAHDFVEHKDGSFGFDLGRTRGDRGFRPENPAHNTSEAIPVLFTDGGSRDLDGIYTVNYSPEKLAIKPSSKKVDIPDPKEIRNTSAQALRFLYQTANGSFEVTFGNGIVTLYPQDEPALSIITAKDRKAERAVLASGLLTAIEDLGVTPVEIRAVYIFNVMEGQTAEA